VALMDNFEYFLKPRMWRKEPYSSLLTKTLL
jgi:hypothetical protein